MNFPARAQAPVSAFSPFPVFSLPYTDGRGPNSGRIVLHADLNNFFASVECLDHPSYRGHPVAVCGDPEKRHGIVLAKNELAKKYGVTTGEAIFQAKKKCPSLLTVPAHYDRYMLFSRSAREIYRRYTDRVEPFGMDEAWLELTGSVGVKSMEDGARVADEIRKTVRKELGITLSVGVSDNKVFAKLGSDYKKPDAVTVLSPREYGAITAGLPISDILFAGRATTERLRSFGLLTIGQVAAANPYFMKSILGKNGLTLLRYCRGEDESHVALFGQCPPIKSMSNSTTPPRDITDFAMAKQILSSLCGTVCSRLREENLKCGGVGIHLRDTTLRCSERICKLERPTSNAVEMLRAAMRLLRESSDLEKTPLRSIGVKATALSGAGGDAQLSLFPGSGEKKDILDRTADALRKRYGTDVLRTAFDLCDTDGAAKIERGYEVFTHLR